MLSTIICVSVVMSYTSCPAFQYHSTFCPVSLVRLSLMLTTYNVVATSIQANYNHCVDSALPTSRSGSGPRSPHTVPHYMTHPSLRLYFVPLCELHPIAHGTGCGQEVVGGEVAMVNASEVAQCSCGKRRYR